MEVRLRPARFRGSVQSGRGSGFAQPGILPQKHRSVKKIIALCAIVPVVRRAVFPSLMTSQQPTFSISDLAQEFALTTRAIRFYEDEGLLTPTRSGRNRIYAARDRTRLKLILRGKRLGLALAEIREILDLYDTNVDEVPQLRKFVEILEARRSALLQQREDIDAVLAEVDGLLRQTRKTLDRSRRSRSTDPT